ncbi:hypothetical protein EV421DRAFT_953078 [Armillaria borealis]|uniref:Secreted protein n=1 Tax=Armillaria borealis TaxID=47425 RepID=A0AA39JAV2_9AGAR|nr:hypothetical protein EV421DRAFT_953078 [Armillaria borealis]
MRFSPQFLFVLHLETWRWQLLWTLAAMTISWRQKEKKLPSLVYQGHRTGTDCCLLQKSFYFSRVHDSRLFAVMLTIAIKDDSMLRFNKRRNIYWHRQYVLQLIKSNDGTVQRCEAPRPSAVPLKWAILHATRSPRKKSLMNGCGTINIHRTHQALIWSMLHPPVPHVCLGLNK